MAAIRWRGEVEVIDCLEGTSNITFRYFSKKKDCISWVKREANYIKNCLCDRCCQVCYSYFKHRIRGRLTKK